jgi:nucleoside 2-deoxyribosyltransferase
VTDQKPFAFVLMPFAPEFDDIYKLGIQAAAEEQAVIAQRVDEQFYSESMLERIYRQIEAADFVIADMTGQNPNVFYEVGYAHAKGKLCSLLTKTAADIPFDLKQHRHLVYDSSLVKLKSMLSSEFSWLKSEHEKSKIQPISVKMRDPFAMLKKTEHVDEAEISFTFDIHNNSASGGRDIEAIYLHTGSGWDFSQDKVRCPSIDSDISLYKTSHFLRPPVSRLPPGGWAQVKVLAKKWVWSSFAGAERKEDYRLTGVMHFVIASSQGNVSEKINVDLKVEEFPF